MDTDAAVAAFQAMIEASQSAGTPCEITMRAVPVVAAEWDGETVQVVDHQLPAGTNPATPDALAMQLRVAGELGKPVPAEVVETAAEHGLRIGTSDALLI